MPKLKTHKGAAARFHVTGTGKLLRMKGNRSHIRRTKSAATKRLFAKKLAIGQGVSKRIRRMIADKLR